MVRRLLFLALLSGSAAGVGCGPGVDLATALTVTDVLTGWYDFGVTKEGLNKLVPSITFRLQNASTRPITSIGLTVAFWRDGEDGEWDSREVQGISSTPVAPGGYSEAITVRADVGVTTEGARSDIFGHSQFKDATAKLFAKRGGKIVPIGQFKLDRRVLPHSSQAPGQK